MKRTCRFWALAIMALLAAGPVFAQGTTGAVEGKVTDEQGGALPGANVTIQNTATGFVRSSVTDAAGVYRIPGLPAGNYDLKIDLTGFAQSTRRVVVNVGAVTTP